MATPVKSFRILRVWFPHPKTAKNTVLLRLGACDRAAPQIAKFSVKGIISGASRHPKDWQGCAGPFVLSAIDRCRLVDCEAAEKSVDVFVFARGRCSCKRWKLIFTARAMLALQALY